MPVCLVTSEWTGNNAGCVLTFSGKEGVFFVSAIGAFHAKASRVSSNSDDNLLQKLFRRRLPQFKKVGTVLCRTSLTGLYLGNTKKPFNIKACPPPFFFERGELLWNFSERILKTTISFERYAGPLSEFFRSELSRSDFLRGISAR